jgi:hypothetical protein
MATRRCFDVKKASIARVKSKELSPGASSETQMQLQSVSSFRRLRRRVFMRFRVLKPRYDKLLRSS